MKRAATLLFLGLMSLAMPAHALSERDCDAHRDSVLDALARNRAQSIRDVEEALRTVPSDDERRRLEHQREQAWEDEERMRHMGDQIWRDCMAHVRATGTGHR